MKIQQTVYSPANTIHTNTTHQIYTFIFILYYIHISVPHTDHDQVQYWYRRKSDSCTLTTVSMWDQNMYIAENSKCTEFVRTIFASLQGQSSSLC